MDIETFMSSMRKNHSRPRAKERQELLEAFLTVGDGILHDQVKVTLVPVFTTTVYPQCVKLSDRYYILWDNMFWDLYDRFLFCALYFQAENEKVDYNFIQNYLLSMSLLFLSNRLEKHPALAYLFGRKYKSDYPLVYSYDCKEDKSFYQTLREQGHAHKSNLGKWFAYFHELTHIGLDSQDVNFRSSTTEIVIAIQLK